MLIAKMKFFAALLLLYTIKNCNGQTHPMAYARSRTNNIPESANEVLINTDRLTSSLESRILSIVRSETNAIKQQLNRSEQPNIRLEGAISSLKNDVDKVKAVLESLRSRLSRDQNISSDSSVGELQKLENLGLVTSAIRSTLNRVERDVMIIKKGLRNSNGIRHGQHALISTRDDPSNDRHGICSESDSNRESGLRKLQQNFFAYCEMKSGDAHGWIVIQNRFDGSTDFFRSWTEYKNGFGNIAGEFWLGLDKIHELTSSQIHELSIEMEDFGGVRTHAKYSGFAISGEANAYALSVLGKFSGDAEDSLRIHAGMKFSTFDNDQDGWTDGNCARSHFGGWWYNSCDESNLNGRYFENGEVAEANLYQGMYWKTFGGPASSLKAVKMMIRPIA